MNTEKATFAGGCFWCTQHDFDEIEGIVSTTVGYIGGDNLKPSYEEVCGGKTGHYEALEVLYDPKKVSYEELLKVYWNSIEPQRSDGQFCDVGPQYRPVIFYHSESQKQLAEATKQELTRSKKIPVAVEILPATTFFPAEDYHQKYYEKNPARYRFYHDHSGRPK